MIWSDETKVNRIGSDGLEWAWKEPGSLIEDQHVQKTVKFGGGSLMMWGCMAAQVVGFACRIDGTMDAHLYTSILENKLVQTLEYYMGSKPMTWCSNMTMTPNTPHIWQLSGSPTMKSRCCNGHLSLQI